MKDIRDSLTIEKIRAYHSHFYRAENLAVIVAGQVDIGEIAKALESIEKKILERKGKLPPYEKPWQTPVKPLTESKDLKVLFPSDEEVSARQRRSSVHFILLSNFRNVESFMSATWDQKQRPSTKRSQLATS